jgi:GDPmannose 4,6-dehydratase
MRALITGVTGQDGAYLSRLLLEKGYEVYGMARFNAQPNRWRLEAVGAADDVHILRGDLTDKSSIDTCLDESAPDVVFNLAAQTHVGDSFRMRATTWETNYYGFNSLLDLLRGTGCRLYQASTSEMFGSTAPPQNEYSTFAPVSPYGHAKLSAHRTAQAARSEGEFVACGILFNHESALRGRNFVTQKIAQGIRGRLHLGDLSPTRDWGHAADYVRAMHDIAFSKRPDDYVVATGHSHSVEDFLRAAARAAGVKPDVVFDERFVREKEVQDLRGDATKAREELGWRPEISFEQLVESMVAGEVYPSGYKIAA